MLYIWEGKKNLSIINSTGVNKMKIYEVSKGDAGIRRGLVMMAIEGHQEAIQAIKDGLEASGYPSTDCADYGDNDGDLIEYFMISRSSVADFRSCYRNIKSTAI